MAEKLTNFYQMLGVAPEVGFTEIKRAYRRLAKTNHPDLKYTFQSETEQARATEFMMRLNEAYEILADQVKRAEYDSLLSARPGRVIQSPLEVLNEGETRELFLRQIFIPSRTSIVKVLNRYKKELTDLSLDIYDDELVETFTIYVDEVERTLLKSANSFSSRPTPRSLNAAVQMMRYAIAQASDGLDELKRFCQNYDYDHLHMAQNLFRESNDLSRQAQQLTKSY
jgi:curved DNA-binding protein CbpA